MITDYTHILAGLPVMYLIEVIAMFAVLIAIAMDLMFGWRKAKERNEARTSYALTRTITKTSLYEGVMLIFLCIDTLVHFVWAMFISSIVYCVPIASCLAGVVICVVEVISMTEKAEDKTRNNFQQAIKIVAEAIPREQATDLAKAILNRQEKNEDN